MNTKYNPNPITEITKALVCQMDDEGYSVSKIGNVLRRDPKQVSQLLKYLKSNGSYLQFVHLKDSSRIIGYAPCSPEARVCFATVFLEMLEFGGDFNGTQEYPSSIQRWEL